VIDGVEWGFVWGFYILVEWGEGLCGGGGTFLIGSWDFWKGEGEGG
jgi:hypothetical protein